MSIRFQCPHCGAIHGINEQAIGRRVRCRDCQELMEVVPLPGPPDAEEPPDETQFFHFEDDDRPLILPREPLKPVDVPPPPPPPRVLGGSPGPHPSGPVHRPPPPPPSASRALPEDTVVVGKGESGPATGDEALARWRRPMSARLRRPPAEPHLDMTPMVDVTFQLLIFFMLTASFTLQKSLPFPPPQTSGATQGGRTLADFQQDPSYIVVRIDAHNTFHISANRWEDEIEAPSPLELLLKLRQARQAADRLPPPSKLLVVAHGDALHERVVAALDAGTEVGIPEIQLVTVEEEIGTWSSPQKN